MYVCMYIYVQPNLNGNISGIHTQFFDWVEELITYKIVCKVHRLYGGVGYSP